MERALLKSLFDQVSTGKKSVEEAVDWLLMEMGRGGRIFVVDENLFGLDDYLVELGYTVYRIQSGLADSEIKQQVGGRVLITNNGEDFASDTERFGYGLIWVTRIRDFATLAKNIEAAIMAHGFRRNLTQVIKV